MFWFKQKKATQARLSQDDQLRKLLSPVFRCIFREAVTSASNKRPWRKQELLNNFTPDEDDIPECFLASVKDNDYVIPEGWIGSVRYHFWQQYGVFPFNSSPKLKHHRSARPVKM